MIYKSLPNYTLETLTELAHQILDSETPYSQDEVEDISGVMLSFAIYKINFTFAEALCEKFIKSTNDDLRWYAIICVGHIARVYSRLVNSNIMQEVNRINKDLKHPVWGATDIAFGDINVFLKTRKIKNKKNASRSRGKCNILGLNL